MLGAALGLALLAAPCPQDKLVLEDGEVREGRVVFVGPSSVVLRESGKDREFERSQVSEIDWLRGRQTTLFERARALPEDSLQANLDLARFALANQLPGEARAFFWRVLFLDPENVEAHEGLRHEQRGGHWKIKHDRKKYDFADFSEVVREWKHAFELETTHYQLKTNLPLNEAVQVALDLERLYLAFYAAFGDDLALFECTAPMSVSIHADSKSFPESLGGGRAYFSQLPNVLFVDASLGLLRYELAHELTHQLLYTATELESKRSGALPAWLDEGFAEYVAASTVAAPEPIALELGFPNRQHFGSHGSASKPLSLSRTLGLQTPDFTAHTRASEMYAQSYTLVHWCLHADGGAHREDFFAYLRGAFEGRSSPTRFKKDMQLPRDFEERWQAYSASEAQ